MPATILLLNGPGSSGKTTLARAIQGLAREVFLLVQMDAFLDMMPAVTLGRADGLSFQPVQKDGRQLMVVHSGPAVFRTLKGMRHAIAAMAEQGCNMVVDEVLFERSVLEEYRELLRPYVFLAVGVHCPLEILEQRERDRGDREIGLARAQFDIVHRGHTYDLEIDTCTRAPEDCARLVVERFGL